jgi:hypothetical protein
MTTKNYSFTVDGACNVSGTNSYTENISKATFDAGAVGYRQYTTTVTSRSPNLVSNGGITVYEVPYARFYGNDIHATGASGGLSGQISFNTRDTLTGGGEQYAAIAASLLNINTAAFRTSSPLPANGLAIRNFTNWANERDISGALPQTPTGQFNTGSINGLGAGYYTNPGSVSINQSLGVASKITIKAGNIDIAGDITSTGPSSPFNNNTTPVILIVSDGDINIHNNVQRIDAILIAHGNINTCSNVSRNTWHTGCRQKLTINGAIGAASHINFQRSIGTRLLGVPGEDVGAAGAGNMPGSAGSTYPTSSAAEVVNFPAYLYFATPYLIDNSKTGSQAIFNAAPLL